MPGQDEAQVILNLMLRKNNFQKGAVLEQKAVGRTTPAIQVSGEEEKRQKK